MDNVRTDSQRADSYRWFVAAIAITIALQIELVFNRPVNWDEFFHLSEAHAFQQGRLTEVLQVFYARAFFWLPMLPVDSVDQIRIARLFMLGFELFTVAAIFAMARRFADRAAAALAALAYVTGGYVFQHGFSYRADPMAAAFLMGALWILLKSRLDAKAIIGAAFLAGLAALTTIKVVFYAPAFAGVAWLRWQAAGRSRAMLLRLATFGALALAFALLFLGMTALTVPDVGQRRATKTLSTAGSMMFDEGFFPQWPYGRLAIASAPLLACLLFATPFGLVADKLQKHHRVVLAALMLPLASLLFYRNAFPYFYAYILPPAMVAATIGAAPVVKRYPAPLLCSLFLINAAILSFMTPRSVLAAQRQVIAAVHEIFPQPVAYFDFPGMIVDYPKANFFMTTWGMRKYRTGSEESFLEVMKRETVPLLIVNREPIERNQAGVGPAPELLPADGAALRDGYIAHWGPLWVAGRRFGEGADATDFDIFAPGTYTIEGSGAVIDGQQYKAGEIVVLARGSHRFEPVGSGEARLRWGRMLRRPVQPFMGDPLFQDF